MNHIREAALTDEDGFPCDFEQRLPSMGLLSLDPPGLKRTRKIPNRISVGETGEIGRVTRDSERGGVVKDRPKL